MNNTFLTIKLINAVYNSMKMIKRKGKLKTKTMYKKANNRSIKIFQKKSNMRYTEMGR